MKQHLLKVTLHSFVCSMLIMQPVVSVLAETITIGKGTGILWEGLPFYVTVNKPLKHNDLRSSYGLLSISDSTTGCMLNNKLKNIAGHMALPINGLDGVGLIPRATGVARYKRENGEVQTLSGTFGLPETKGSSPSQDTIFSAPGYAWCLPPKNDDESTFYSPNAGRTAELSGDWVLVADGSQRVGEGAIQKIYFGSYSFGGGDVTSQILPEGFNLRVSTLECRVSTPTAINFGPVNRSTKAGVELALMPVGLVASCGQNRGQMINANINLQFRAVSGLYNNEPSWLALNQSGGYITGEIDGGATGSGNCGATTGLRFDNTMVKLGNITDAETEKTFSHQLIWRLCSGGSSLPSGLVNASTEMLVTFN